jgi:branched-chain amino acid aminotransferase
MIKATEKIWHNGSFIKWEDAKVHVLAHALHYGTSIFEGIRCYDTPAGPAIFRAREHLRRLADSARIYRMVDIGYTGEQLLHAMTELVRVNHMGACYLRPLVIRGYGEMGILPDKCPIEVYIACWEWGKYLGLDAQTDGVDVCVSSWLRLAPNTLPAMSKAGANYMNSQLIKMEAVTNGYAEAIALDTAGYVSEGSGENVFLVRDGRLYTPPLGTSALPGITRSTILTLARELGIEILEQAIPREMLYIADEIFFSGTAVELTPVRSVDRIKVGNGRRGPVTEQLQREFFSIVSGKTEDRHGWLTLVNVGNPVAA